MKIAITTFGTRGDIQPFVALALKLQERGHQVNLAASQNLKTFVTNANLTYSPVEIDSRVLFESEEGQRWLSSGKASAFLKQTNSVLYQLRKELRQGVIDACKGADLIISGILVDELAGVVAEKNRIPYISVHYAPYVSTMELPSVVITTANLPFGFMKRITHFLQEKVWWSGKRDDINEFRREMGLPEGRSSMMRRPLDQPIPVIGAWSPALFPKPHDWPRDTAVTGFLRLPTVVKERMGETNPPARLVEWLKEGSAPFFLGFGSMPILQPDQMIQATIEASRRLGIRLLVGAGWSNLAAVKEHRLPKDVFVLSEAVDHEWLFPQCAGVIHHGGSGTIGAGITAGCPTWVFAVFADQPFWGSRMARLGLGGVTPFKNINQQTLEEALRVLGRPEVKRRANALGEILRGEDGESAAAQKIEELAQRGHIPHV
jgi:sterol 3beta-glucosyltransferase